MPKVREYGFLTVVLFLLTSGTLLASGTKAPEDSTRTRQGMSLRTNLLWDAAAEPNIGLEFPLSKHFSLGANAGLKSWPRWLIWDTDIVNNTRHWRNFAVVPELRFYFDQVYDGWFVGADIVYTHYNVGNVTIPLYPEVKDTRVQGDFLGLGLFGGYSWWLGRHWRLEAEAGVAAGWAGYGRYECAHCGTKLGDVNKLALVPKLGVNIAWNPVPRQEDCGVAIPLRPVPDELPVPVPKEDPGDFRPNLPQVEPHRGAVDSVKTPFLQHISDFQPYTPDQVLRKKRGMVKVYYPQGKSSLQLQFKDGGLVRNNQPALDSIVNITRMILADDLSQVEKIQIVGFSSIEGSESANGKLAKARAQALKDYVQQKTHAAPDAFVVENGVEGWAEFKDLLEDLLKATRQGRHTGFTGQELETAIAIAGTPTLDPAEGRRKELELKKHPALWAKIKENVLREQRNSGYVRVYVSWAPDKLAQEMNAAIDEMNAGRVEEHEKWLETLDDERAVATLETLRKQRKAYDQAARTFRDYENALVRWRDTAAARQEALEWNAMARQHNRELEECDKRNKR